MLLSSLVYILQSTSLHILNIGFNSVRELFMWSFFQIIFRCSLLDKDILCRLQGRAFHLKHFTIQFQRIICEQLVIRSIRSLFYQFLSVWMNTNFRGSIRARSHAHRYSHTIYSSVHETTCNSFLHAHYGLKIHKSWYFMGFFLVIIWMTIWKYYQPTLSFQTALDPKKLNLFENFIKILIGVN